MFGPSLKVCCGPRCGAEPGHRAIYAAVEAAAPGDLLVRPTMCQGLCGAGVTVVVPPNETGWKIRDSREASDVLEAALSGISPERYTKERESKCPPSRC